MTSSALIPGRRAVEYAPTPRPIHCERCGKDHERCIGHRTSDGMPCQKWPDQGADVCRAHGAAAGHVSRKAAERVQLAKLQRALPTLGLPIDDLEADPFDQLREEIRRTAGHIRWLEIAVGDLERDELGYGLMEEDITESTEETTGGAAGTGSKSSREVLTRKMAQLNIYYQAYLGERKHLVETCHVAIKAGLAEREVVVTEELAAQFITAQRIALLDPRSGLSPEQVEMVWRLTEETLRAPRPAIPASLSTGGLRTVPR